MKRFKARQIYLLFILVLSVFFITGCGGGGGEGEAETGHWLPYGQLMSIEVTPAMTSIPISGTQQFKATATYSDGSTIDVTASSSWTSGTASVATVSPTSGFATGIATGTSLITATFGGLSDSATLNVTAATSTKFEVMPATASIPVSGTKQYTAIETFSDGSTIDRTASSNWTSANVPLGGADVATVSSALPTKGLATGKTVGQSDITATFGAQTAKGRLTVNAATSTKFEVKPAAASIPVSGTQQFAAIETFSDGTTIDRTASSTWTSANVPVGGAPVATVSSALPTKGLATGNVIGQSTINATFGSLSNSATLNVTAATSVSFVVTPATASISVTGTQQYTAIETFSDRSTIDRTASSDWTSANVPVGGALVASVGLHTGLATGNAPGQSDITATFGAQTAKGRLTVTKTVTNTPNLRTAAPFGTFGGSAGMTNTGNLTIINGDIGTIATGNSAITGFHERAGGVTSLVDDSYTDTLGANSGKVTGRIYTCTVSTTGPTVAAVNAASCGIATQGRLDAQTAYLALAAMPSDGTLAGNLAGTTIAPGVYTNSSSVLIEGGDLTLDAGGDANAVFVFQIGSTLTVGGPGVAAPQSIILAGGAQAKNVFWQVGTAATINAGGGGTMVGTIIANSGVTFSTAGKTAITTLNGRALSLISSVTMVNTVINVPAP